MNDIKLTDLISVDALQKIQDGFSEYTGMAALTTDSDGVPVTQGSGFTRFCMEYTRRSERGCMHCEECDKMGALITLEHGKATVYDCHAGLTEFAAPIMVNGKVIGSFIGGQVRSGEIDEENIRRLAVKYGIAPQEYVDAVRQTRELAKDRIEKAAIFLAEIADGLSGMAYRNFIALQESIRMEKAAKSQADFVINMSANLENSVAHWFNIVENTIEKSKQPEIVELLSQMQADGEEMRQNIHETIEFIKMSEKKLELMESRYQLRELIENLKGHLERKYHGNEIIIDVLLDEQHSECLFGDSGRISQMVNKLISAIMKRKKTGRIQIDFSTSISSYATILDIVICDEHTGFSENEIRRMEECFLNGYEGELGVEKISGFGISLVTLLLKKMTGEIKLIDGSEDLVFQISLPQLGV